MNLSVAITCEFFCIRELLTRVGDVSTTTYQPESIGENAGGDSLLNRLARVKSKVAKTVGDSTGDRDDDRHEVQR